MLHLWQYIDMETTIKTPVQLAIAEFGGVRALARAIHRDPASVSKWQKGDGTIPTSIQRKLLETAWDRGCLLYTSPSPRDVEESRMPSSA